MKIINYLKREQGITLIELAVILIILSILIATVTTRFISYANAVKTEACMTNLHIIDQVQALYYLQHGEYAGSMEDLAIYFVRELPECPAGGEYVISEDGHTECTVHGTAP